MRIGLYGGSFDPIHLGHVAPVRQAAEAMRLERVLYMPTGRPPHKKGCKMAPAWARFAMVELALLEEPDFHVSPIELREDRPSYTFETVESLRRERPGDELVLLIGSDSFCQLDQWREWRRILAAVELGILRRPGCELVPADLALPLRQALARGRAHEIDNRPLAMSSREIRGLLADRDPEASHMLHHLVLDYVGKYELYSRDT